MAAPTAEAGAPAGGGLDAVPVIDLGRTDREAVRCEIDAACAGWGFFQVVGHGIPEPLVAALLDEMHAFFSAPAAEKAAVRRTAENAWGWNDRELTKNRRDHKEIFDVGPAILRGPLAGNQPQWPAGRPRFRRVVEAYASACERTGRHLIGLIAECLGMPRRFLDAAFPGDHTSFLRLNHYPVHDMPVHDMPVHDGAASAGRERPEAHELLGVGRHTDAGALTLLLQDDQPGLQVRRAGAWHGIEPRRGALVVNIGDVVQVWSNDRYRAPLHRVLASRGTVRQSAPYFLNPGPDVVFEPLPSTRGDGRPARYRAIRWGEYRAARAAGDYADLGREVQVEDFRIA